MFGYKTFENNIVQQMEVILDKWIKENDDIYIFALDCARGMESIGVIANTIHYLAKQAEPFSSEYWYYKYSEEEWELFYTFEDISADMNKYLDENDDIFSDTEAFEYSDDFDEHCEKIIECCVNALIRFRRSLSQNNINILLTFNVREYFDEEDRIEIFERINRKGAVKEYAEHIEEFV